MTLSIGRQDHGLSAGGFAYVPPETDWRVGNAADQPVRFMWLRAFCPQACYAGGPGRFRDLLYKDVNRPPVCGFEVGGRWAFVPEDTRPTSFDTAGCASLLRMKRSISLSYR
jgi:hypothetical protein